MPHSKTVAFFRHGGFLAHVTRTFEVGRVLARALEYRVVFCGEGPYMHIPRNAGFEARSRWSSRGWRLAERRMWAIEVAR